MYTLAVIGQFLFGLFWISNAYNHFKNTTGLTNYAKSKGVPSPKIAVVVTGILLLIGGIGILLGNFLFWAILALVVFIVPTAFKMHNFWAVSDPNEKMMEKVQFWKDLALLGALLLMWSLPNLAYSLF